MFDGESRLTGKFPSDTTFWKVLRTFESQDVGKAKNLTGRGLPVHTSQGAGTQDVCYETPVIQIMGRELSTFVDLQKTLAQLGFNSGSALLRLSFKKTDTRLEEAMQQMSHYFGQEARNAAEHHPHNVLSSNKVEAPPATSTVGEDQEMVGEPSASEIDSSLKHSKASDSTNITKLEAVTILVPPMSNGGRPTYDEFDEKDFVPTVDHARLHQSRLAIAGTNKRLLSDAELSAQAKTQKERLEDVKTVEIKVRFPDQMQAISTFSREDTASSLYSFVRSVMANDHEPFSLSFTSVKGPQAVPQGAKGDLKLITELGMTGKVLVNFIWGDGASLEARQTPALKGYYREKAQEIQFKPVPGTTADERLAPVTEPDIKPDKDRKGGIPKWLKLGRK